MGQGARRGRLDAGHVGGRRREGAAGQKPGGKPPAHPSVASLGDAPPVGNPAAGIREAHHPGPGQGPGEVALFAADLREFNGRGSRARSTRSRVWVPASAPCAASQPARRRCGRRRGGGSRRRRRQTPSRGGGGTAAGARPPPSRPPAAHGGVRARFASAPPPTRASGAARPKTSPAPGSDGSTWGRRHHRPRRDPQRRGLGRTAGPRASRNRGRARSPTVTAHPRPAGRTPRENARGRTSPPAAPPALGRGAGTSPRPAPGCRR